MCLIYTGSVRSDRFDYPRHQHTNARLNLHNGLFVIGVNENGVMTLATTEATTPASEALMGYISLNVNGTDRYALTLAEQELANENRLLRAVYFYLTSLSKFFLQKGW